MVAGSICRLPVLFHFQRVGQVAKMLRRIWTTTTDLAVRLNGTTRFLYHPGNITVPSQAEAEAGSGTTSRLWNALRDRQAIIAGPVGTATQTALNDKVSKSNDVGTAADITAGTVGKFPDAAAVKAAIGSSGFTSPDTTFAFGTVYQFAHGLGKVPTEFDICYVCKTAIGGFTVGMITTAAYTDASNNDGSAVSYGTYVWADATNVYACPSPYGTFTRNLSNGGKMGIGANEWNLRVRAK